MPEPIELDKESFHRWLARQPDTRVFKYTDCFNCLFASFAKEELQSRNPMCGHNFIMIHGVQTDIPSPFAQAASNAYDNGRNTFISIAQFKSALAKQLHRETL